MRRLWLQQVLEPSVRASLVNVQRWFLTLAHQPQVVAVVGALTLCAAPPVYDPKKYQELTQKKVGLVLLTTPIIHPAS